MRKKREEEEEEEEEDKDHNNNKDKIDNGKNDTKNTKLYKGKIRKGEKGQNKE